MTITVILEDEAGFRQVPDFLLDELIAAGKVKAFLRSSGWAVIGQHPVRGRATDSYDGPERRRQRRKSCILCPDMHRGVCISEVCSDRYKQAKFYRPLPLGL